jgi:hypothetical protein
VTVKPQNEEDTLPVCSALVQKLNSDSESWGHPVKAVEAIYFDCECVHLRDRKKKLLIRVTSLATICTQWGKEGAWREDGAAVEGLADSIMALIRFEASMPGDRSNVVLALGAATAPQHSLAATVLAFGKRHGASATLAGFKEIWLVGPDSATTHCLTR